MPCKLRHLSCQYLCGVPNSIILYSLTGPVGTAWHRQFGFRAHSQLQKLLMWSDYWLPHLCISERPFSCTSGRGVLRAYGSCTHSVQISLVCVSSRKRGWAANIVGLPPSTDQGPSVCPLPWLHPSKSSLCLFQISVWCGQMNPSPLQLAPLMSGKSEHHGQGC